MDFTLDVWISLIDAFISRNYKFYGVSEFIANKPEGSTVILRHDVDSRPDRSLAFARHLSARNIEGTFYFRIIKGSYNEKIITEIHSMGHEIGYHYEDIDLIGRKCYNRPEADILREAIESFGNNLDKIRSLVPVTSICMHGSPMSKFDNKLLWKYYDYRNFGIIGEPYFDIDFSKVAYYTDTGRMWDGDSFSIRDRTDAHIADFKKYHSTKDIINALNSGLFPEQSMLTFHPQRWTNEPLSWIKELIWQNMKNSIKRLIIKMF
jgi:hypothetical protein